MKKILYTLLPIIIPLLMASCADGFQCGARRDLSSSKDKKIDELQRKIAEYEKNQIKDVTTSDRLAGSYNQLGIIYLESNLWDSAVDSFKKSIQYGTRTPGVFYSLGLAYANRGKDANSDDDFVIAEKNYKRAIELQSDYYDARYSLAILFFYHKDEKDRGITMLEEINAENRKYFKARFALGKFYYETEKLAKSLNTYEELNADLQKEPSNQIINDYRKQCKENISLVMMEVIHKKGQ